MDIHYPPADPRLTFDDTVSDAIYRAYHRLLARAWNNDSPRQLVLSKSEILKLLGCSRSSMYVYLDQLVSHALIAYYSVDGRTVITFRNDSVQNSGQSGKTSPEFWTESRNLDSNPGIQIPGQVESPAPLKELINTVVVVDPPQENHDQQLLLGSPETWMRWPVHEICNATGVFPSRRPGHAKWPYFIAWLIYGYQNKAETRGEGIVSPVLFAVTRLDMHPGRVYLDMALAGPIAVLEAMDDLTRSKWIDILVPAKENGLYALLDPFFPATEEDAP